MKCVVSRRNGVFRCLLLLVLSVSSYSLKAADDGRVFYRASDGKSETVYVIGITKPELERIVNLKVGLWDSLMRCEATKKMTFKDPFFSNEIVTMKVEVGCTLSLTDSFGDFSCISNPVHIMNIKSFFEEDVERGYGAEYLTRYEKDYVYKNCRVK